MENARFQEYHDYLRRDSSAYIFHPMLLNYVQGSRTHESGMVI